MGKHNHARLLSMVSRHQYIDDLAAEYNNGTARNLQSVLENTLGVGRKPTNPDSMHCPRCMSSHNQSMISKNRDRSSYLMSCHFCTIDYRRPYVADIPCDLIRRVRAQNATKKKQAAALELTNAEYMRVYKSALVRGTVEQSRFSDSDFAEVFNKSGGSTKSVCEAFDISKAYASAYASRLRKHYPDLLAWGAKYGRRYDYREVASVFNKATGNRFDAVAKHYGITYSVAHGLVQRVRASGEDLK